MILVIDNYDSFTYNLVQILLKHEYPVRVIKSDEWTTAQIDDAQKGIKAFLLSPGPGHPSQAVLSRHVVQKYHRTHPILGVCLGHQVIAEVFGASVVQATRLMHGKISTIEHQKKGSFLNLKSPLKVVRYHSLIVQESTLPDCLEPTAWCHHPGGTKELMALKHREWPVEGFQFHPESILTESGEDLVLNFLKDSYLR